MKISEEQLKQSLKELYTYYFKMARDAENKPDTEELSYEEIKSLGAVDAVSAIYLQCFGGEAMMELWLKNVGKEK